MSFEQKNPIIGPCGPLCLDIEYNMIVFENRDGLAWSLAKSEHDRSTMTTDNEMRLRLKIGMPMPNARLMQDR
jgi:hypothetical protein